MTIEECYRVLDLKPGASLKEVKQAFLLQSKLYHPDRHFQADEKTKKFVERKQKELNEAHSTLSSALWRSEKVPTPQPKPQRPTYPPQRPSRPTTQPPPKPPRPEPPQKPSPPPPRQPSQPDPPAHSSSKQQTKPYNQRYSSQKPPKPVSSQDETWIYSNLIRNIRLICVFIIAVFVLGALAWFYEIFSKYFQPGWEISRHHISLKDMVDFLTVLVPIGCLIFLYRIVFVLVVYAYFRMDLSTPITLKEASCVAFLFDCERNEMWYPMRELREMPKGHRRKYLLEFASKISQERQGSKRDSSG